MIACFTKNDGAYALPVIIWKFPSTERNWAPVGRKWKAKRKRSRVESPKPLYLN
jgi:hypothetical protein